MTIVHISATRDACPWHQDSSFPTLRGAAEDIVEQIQHRYSNAHLFVIDLDEPEEETLYELPDDFEAHFDTEFDRDGASVASVPKEQEQPTEGVVGIRVLKLLRLKAMRQHCIVYSTRSREAFLIEDPRNSILGAPGTTYVHLGSDQPAPEYEKLVRQYAPEDLRLYFASEVNAWQGNVSLSNSWGVWKLWEVQRAVEQITSERSEDIARSLGRAYTCMNTYEGLLARYVKGSPYQDINKSLNEKLLLWGNLLDQQQEVSKQREAELIAIETLRQSIEQWSKLRDSKPADIEAAIQTIAALEASVERANDILAKCQAIQMERSHISARKYMMNLRLSNELNKVSDNTFESMRRTLQSRAPKIVYVDPLARDGWAQILQRVIYGRGEHAHFYVIAPQEGGDQSALAEQIFEAVETHDADLLMIDLQLSGERGLAGRLENATSIQILSDLSERLCCPILITSTSDKMPSFRDLLSWGATASWTKQGLSERNDVEYTVSNYVQLIQNIHQLCYNPTIDFCYRQFLPMIHDVQFAPQGELWWESRHEWGAIVGYQHERPNRETVLQILDASYGHMCELIGSTIMSGVADELSPGDNSLLVARLYHVLEHLYKIEKLSGGDEDYMPIYKRVQLLSPQVSSAYVTERLISPRNSAVHAGETSAAVLEGFVQHLIDLLLGERCLTQDLEEDRYYTSRVSHILANGYGTQNMYFLKNNEIRLTGGRDSITLIDEQVIKAGYVPADIQVGTYIKHKVKASTNAKGEPSYYAYDVEISH